jgi:eukaryotic-like serine/threonine-protein kinase
MNKDLATNTTLSHYRIVSKIGAGGMGEVYLAQDTKLDRKVAIKFLHEEFSKDADKLARFIQEAKAASALNHPNILTVYEIGEVDGKNYISTELIDGQTLRERLSQKEALPLNSILKISVQVAEALSAAHQAGIIHRDIKPENIMLRKDGYAKVLDFGLAKLSEPSALAGASATDGEAPTRVHQTHPGTIMGTVSYMSPEQARGKKTDVRTDIWSLGVVLYEMLAGKVPFTGETVNHTIVSILEKEPLLLENVPAELQRIVRKSMTKDLDMRYQSARDLLIDLKNLRRDLDIQGELERSIIPNREAATGAIRESETRMYASGAAAVTRSGQIPATQNVSSSSSSLEYAVSQAKSHKLATAIVGLLLLAAISAIGYLGFVYKRSGAGQINSIAVMPFQNRSADADTEYLSDGLAESLIYRLSQLPNLKVSPTSSVFRYKGKETDAQQIGNELGVSAVLTGRIVQRGENLTIGVELVDVRTNKLIWGEQYERKMSELLTTQREIAAEITNKLQLKLSGEGEQKLAKKYTDSNEAYQLYLKGLFHFANRTKEDVQKAIGYFQQATRLDPNFALAYVGISQSYSMMPSYSYLSPKEAFPQAKAAAQKALEIDPSLADAHGALATTFAAYDWNWVEAEREFKRAIELNPNVADIHYRYGLIYLIPAGRMDEAIHEIKRALELEPLSIAMNANLAGAYMYARQNDLALAQARKTFDLEPSHITARVWLANVYESLGMYNEAIALSEESQKNHMSDQYFLFYAGYAYAKTGRREKAEDAITKLRDLEKTEPVDPYLLATLYVGLGDKDKAFVELEKSFNERGYYVPLLRVDPLMDPLRDDPRFADLIKRIGLPK